MEVVGGQKTYKLVSQILGCLGIRTSNLCLIIVVIVIIAVASASHRCHGLPPSTDWSSRKVLCTYDNVWLYLEWICSLVAKNVEETSASSPARLPGDETYDRPQQATVCARVGVACQFTRCSHGY